MPKNYIETLIDEVLEHDSVKFADTNITFNAIRSGTKGYTGEKLDVPIRKALTDLLLKCKEAVGEERNTPKNEREAREILGWNSCRSTTLQNLDNLLKD